MNATILCFKTGRVLNPSDLVNNFAPRERQRAERCLDRIGYWKSMREDIESRYAVRLPVQGCIYKQPLRGMIFDTYGYGCVHNSIHQYRGGKYWNEPFPMPADLPRIEAYLKKNAGRVLKLGYKSDPFMWMDDKYQITKSVIEMATENNVTLTIHTMSDLCAKDDYAMLLSKGGHSIVMHGGFSDSRLRTEEIEKRVSPGAPSLKRRQLAINKLDREGVGVSWEYTRTDEILGDAKKLVYFRQSTGINLTADFDLDLLGGAK